MELKVQYWWLTASALFGLYFVPVVEEEKRSGRELGKLGSEVSAKGLGGSYTNWRIARETRYGCNRGSEGRSNRTGEIGAISDRDWRWLNVRRSRL